MENILTRIAQIAEAENIKITALEKKIGASKGVISRALNNGSDIQSKWVQAIVENYPKYNTFWLLTGSGDMHIDEKKVNSKSEDEASIKPKERAYIEESVVNIAADNRVSEYSLKQDYFNIAKQQIPLYELEASAGMNLLFGNQSQQVPVDYISVPNAPKCDGALFVRGDSMYPLLKSGDIVCYKHIKDIKNNMRFGEIYLLYINDGDDEYLTLKYVHESEKGEDFIKLVSENRHHTPKNEHLSHIKAVALVKLSIRYNTIS